jgi:prepilin signal peptidase PulO-like enzyme (type II secretory pathway)
MDYFAVLFGAAGLLAGMLVNYLADVLPGEPFAARPSCKNTECREPFHWSDYLLMRRCPKCGKRRSARTWILLAVMMVAGAFVWLVPPKGIGPVGGLVVLAYLLTVAIIDLEHHLILRSLSLAGLVICTGAGILARGWQATLIGGAAGFGIIFVIYLFGKLYSRIRFKNAGGGADDEAFASGDVTLALLLGLLVGWPLIWFNLLIGILLSGLVSILVILGTLIARRSGRQAMMTFIPLGPGFILATILIVYLPLWLTRIVPK